MDADHQTATSANEPTVTPTSEAKAKSPRKARGKSPSVDKGNGKRSINLSMPIEDYERFLIHAMKMTGGNISELVCRLGREHLREYHLSRTPGRSV